MSRKKSIWREWPKKRPERKEEPKKRSLRIKTYNKKEK